MQEESSLLHLPDNTHFTS